MRPAKPEDKNVAMKNHQKQKEFPSGPLAHRLSARERQIMDVVHRLGEASARDVQGAIPSAPSYSAVRRMVNILEEKGFLSHRELDGRYIYSPTIPAKEAGVSVLKNLMATFFENSLEQTVATFLSSKEVDVDEAELERLSIMIDKARSKSEGAAQGKDTSEEKEKIK